VHSQQVWLWGDLIAAFQCRKGAYKKARERRFTRAWNDRTRCDGFKLKKGKFRLDIREEILYSEGGEALAQVVDAPPWKGSSQTGWGFQEPGVVEGRWVGTR